MKLNQNTSPVEISGAVGTPSGFNISASKEAFKILSSGLYTNKIRAIIRELSCNAWDAHVAAGKADQSFTLHLPTTFEPFFAVKDDGTGLEYLKGGCKSCGGKGTAQRLEGEEVLTEVCATCEGSGDYDAVKDLYCTYFATSKGDSNLFVGALGLGSKSPFCYTEGFSVTNRYDGMTRIYSCFLNEAGMPAVLLQTEEVTPNAGNGVEVTFPVKQNDVWEFENQAKYVFEFFDPEPSTNLTRLYIERKDYSFRTEKWGMRKDDGKPRAIQGMVQYSIGDIDESKLTYEQQQLTKLPIDLFFPIGKLEVAASRESLSNDERTVQNILKALDGVREGLMDDVKGKIAACQTPWEARLLIYNLQNAAGIGHLVSEAFRKGEFNDVNTNFKISTQDATINQLTYPAVAIHEFTKSYAGQHLYAHKHRLTTELTPETDLTKLSHFDIKFPSNKKALFIINDQGFGTDKYVHYIVQNEKVEADSVYLITRANKDVLWETVAEKGLAIVEALGQPPMKLMTELKATYKEFFSNAGETLPPRKILKFKGLGRGWYSEWSDATNSELPPVKYYLPVKALAPQTGHFTTSDGLKHFLGAVRESGIFGIDHDTPIYGIPTWRVNGLDDTWVELFDHVKKEFLAFFTPEKEAQYSLHLSSNSFSTSLGDILKRISKEKPFGADSLLQKFADQWSLCQRNKRIMEQLGRLGSKLAIMGLYTVPTESINFNSLWNDILEIYPLLKYLGHYSYRETDKTVTADLIQYVNLIDEGRSNLQNGETFASLGVVQSEEEEIYAN